MFVIPGPSREDRRFYFERYLSPKWEKFRVGSIEDVYGPHTTQWLDVGVIEDATTRIRAMAIPADCRDVLPMWCPPQKNVWELLWGLVGVEEFVVEEPLSSLVDQEGSLLHDFYRLVWEARFLAKESVNLTAAQTFMESLLLWVTGGKLSEEQDRVLAALNVKSRVEAPSQQADLLCMVVTLAAQNSLTNRMVIAFDDLELALDHPKRQYLLRGLSQFIEAVDRWTLRAGGCPIGVLVGFADTQTNRARLKEHHPKLAARVEDGLAWTSENDS